LSHNHRYMATTDILAYGQRTVILDKYIARQRSKNYTFTLFKQIISYYKISIFIFVF
jgi:hypothetical protein